MGILTSLILAGLLVSSDSTDKLTKNDKAVSHAIVTKADLKIVMQPALSMGKLSVKVVVHNNPDKVMEVRIRDAKGNLIFSDFVKDKENFSKNYVLNQLTSGKYIMEVANKKEFISEELIVN